MFQDGLKEQITEAVVLVLREAILFFGRRSQKEGLPYTNARDIEFSLTGPNNWAGRTVQVKVTANTVHKGHQDYCGCCHREANRGQEPRAPQGSGRAIRPLAGTCNVDDWMRGLNEGASDGDTCAQCSVECGR